MAAFTIQSANDILNYLLRGVDPSWGGATTLYLSLHTGTIGGGGNQSTNEVAYTGYSRVAVARNASGDFEVASGGASQNNDLIQFGNPTAGSFPITATHVAIGVESSGVGTVLEYAPLDNALIINQNVQPQFLVGTLDFTLV